MLTVDEYHEVIGADMKHYILCERLDMIPDIEEELLNGKRVSYICDSAKESVSEWQQKFEEMTKCNLSTTNSWKGTSFLINRSIMLCRHYARSHPGKTGMSRRDIGCPFKLHIRLCKVAFNDRGSRSSKPDAGYALRVWSGGAAHNHTKAAMLGQRRVSDATRSRLIELLGELRSPVRAWEALRDQLRQELGEQFEEAAQDSAVLPRRHYVYCLNRKLFGRTTVDARYREHRTPRRPHNYKPRPGEEPLEPQKPQKPQEPRQQKQEVTGRSDGVSLPLLDLADDWIGAEEESAFDPLQPPSPPPSSAPLPSSVSTTVTTPPPQSAAAAQARRQLERFTEQVVGRIATGDDWRLWAHGVNTFVHRWDTFSLAGRLALLRGARSAVRVKNRFYAFNDFGAGSRMPAAADQSECSPFEPEMGLVPADAGVELLPPPPGAPGRTVCVLRSQMDTDEV